MAGYIFTLDNASSLESCVLGGNYSTRLSPVAGYWRISHEATFGDYATMQSGDKVFFFIDRHIYGVGELVGFRGRPAFNNFPHACVPQRPAYKDIRDELLVDEGTESPDHRWVCFFKPSPHFFRAGVDMDAVLASDPAKFRMLRAFWKRSFIQCDDAETQALVDVILKTNEKAIDVPGGNVFRDGHTAVHRRVERAIARNPEGYDLNPAPLIEACHDGDLLDHEMALEAALLWKLRRRVPHVLEVFGSWDHSSHQVIASPFKPIDYMDKMDLFGYRFIKDHKPTISRYLVGELKRSESSIEDVDQLLKYVDWVRQEYAGGDYSMIEAFLVASGFPDQVLRHVRDNAKRLFTVGARPAKTGVWDRLTLVRYAYSADSSDLVFERVSI